MRLRLCSQQVQQRVQERADRELAGGVVRSGRETSKNSPARVAVSAASTVRLRRITAASCKWHADSTSTTTVNAPTGSAVQQGFALHQPPSQATETFRPHNFT